MLASTHLDPVIGIDIHWEMIPAPPAPPIPTPLPNPFVGMVWDPMGLAVGILINQVIGRLTGSPPTGAVIVNMLPATNTGTEATGFGHVLIPPGVSWAPMPSVMPVIIPKEPPEEPDNPACPDDDAIVVTGSKTVHVMGANFARLGDLAMSCSEPVRLPSSVIMAIPKGLPVLIGGPPTLDAWAAAGAFIRTQWVSHQLNNLLSHLRSTRLRNLLSRLVCFLTGHPVDVASGRVFTDHVDFELPGPIPLKFERVYNSGFCERNGPLGYGWSHTLDQKVWEERGKVVHLTEDGREIEFDAFHLPGHRMERGDELYYPVDRLTLRCLGEGRWEIWDAKGIGHEFGPVEGGEPGVARLLAKKTRDGHHRIELHYDERGCLSWVRDSGKRQIRFESDAAGRLIAIKLPIPKGEGHYVHSRFGYDESGDLVSVSDPANNSWEFEYAGHLLTRETDRERLSFYFGYDGIGQDAWCVRTWGDGGIYDHQLTYDKKSKVTCVTNSLGHTTTYRMETVGVVVEIIDAHGASTKYEYDPNCLRPTAEVDALERTKRYAYDARGNRTLVEAADGSRFTFSFHQRFDVPVHGTDPAGGEWEWDVDAFGRVTGRRDPLGHWTRFEYEDGLLARETTPGGATTKREYDTSKNLSRIKRGGAETRFEHDRLGRVTKLVNSLGDVERRAYDAIGELARLETSAGPRCYEYDREGNLTRFVSGTADLTFSYSGYHRVHERSEAGTTVRLHYNTEDQLESVENENGELTVYERDACGRVVAEVGFDGSARRLARDALGRVSKVTDPNGSTRTLCYDAVDRVVEVAYSDGDFERYRYRADGVLLEATNQDTEVRFERDTMGRVTRELSRQSDGTESWVRSGYGSDGHRVRVQSSDGHLHHIERNDFGDVDAVELRNGAWRVEFERDSAGLELSRRFPGGASSEFERDAAGFPVRHTVTLKDSVQQRSLEWNAGVLDSIEDGKGAPTRLERDPRGRLMALHQPWGEVQYRAQDAVGNVYRSPGLDDRAYGRGGRIEQAGGTAYHHDGAGNVVAKSDVLGDVTHYRWNAAGMLAAVARPDGTEITYSYDALRRRVAKRVYQSGGDQPSREIRWRWDGDAPLTEVDSETGAATWVFEPETYSPLARIASGEVWGVIPGESGAPGALVAEDGRCAWSSEPDALAAVEPRVSAIACPFRWPGQYEDEETGLFYNRFRYYDPELGRYLSQDPIGLRGGVNPYGYPDDPFTDTDPFGLARRGGYWHPAGVWITGGGNPRFPSLYQARLPRDMRGPDVSDGRQMRWCTRRLRRDIESGTVDAAQFTAQQLEDIAAGKDRIDGLTWHHHENGSLMQLVDRELHAAVGHDGGRKTQGGRC